VVACGLQPELDALAVQHCPAGRGHYHAALYDALAGALLLASLAREPALAQLTRCNCSRSAPSTATGATSCNSEHYF